MKSSLCLIFVLMATAGVAGCQDLVYVHNATLGVDLTVSPDNGTTKLAIGYDRETFTIVPRYSTTQPGGQSTSEAMSLVSVSNVGVSGLDEIIFNHCIATGEAARRMAKDPQGLRMMREAVFGPQGTPANSK